MDGYFNVGKVAEKSEGVGFVPHPSEEAGFEPAVPLRGLRFSRPVHSTALSLLQRVGDSRPSLSSWATFKIS